MGREHNTDDVAPLPLRPSKQAPGGIRVLLERRLHFVTTQPNEEKQHNNKCFGSYWYQAQGQVRYAYSTVVLLVATVLVE